MAARCVILRELWRRRSPLAAVVFVAYFSLLLAPCAMAMGVAGEPPPAPCHDHLTGGGDHDCMDQPVAECGNGAWHPDKRDPTSPKLDLVPVSAAPALLVHGARYRPVARPPGGPAGPPGQPAPHVRFCVFLN